jgi:hypothetical protein
MVFLTVLLRVCIGLLAVVYRLVVSLVLLVFLGGLVAIVGLLVVALVVLGKKDGVP